jgi:hypothetical protein
MPVEPHATSPDHGGVPLESVADFRWAAATFRTGRRRYGVENRHRRRRKFLQGTGRYVGDGGLLVEAPLVFWGEWEAPSYVIKRWSAADDLPRFLHAPVWERPRLGENAFHRRWPMTWRACRPTGVNQRHHLRPSRRAPAMDAAPISGPPADGRAFAARPAGCARIADLLGIKEPKSWSLFSRVIPGKSPYPIHRRFFRTAARDQTGPPHRGAWPRMPRTGAAACRRRAPRSADGHPLRWAGGDHDVSLVPRRGDVDLQRR